MGSLWFSAGMGFSIDSRTGVRTPFVATPGGWDLTLTLQSPNEANKSVNELLSMQNDLKALEGGGQGRADVPASVPEVVRRALIDMVEVPNRRGRSSP